MKVKRFTYGSCVANSYVLTKENSDKAVLIDCCGANKKILDYISECGCELSAILLTHGHFDHIEGYRALRDLTGAKIYIFNSENKFLFDKTLNLSDSDDLIENENNSADVLLNDGDVIKVGDFKIQVIHTPGHTSGSVCYMVGEEIFTGDTLFKQSIGRCDFPTGDYNTEIDSIYNKLFSLRDEVTVYPGHGFSTTIGKEREENPFL